MKNLLVLLIIIPLFGFTIPGNNGIKAKEFNQKYFNHDPIKGFITLESKVSRKLNVEWNRENSTPSLVGGKLTTSGYSNSSLKAEDGIRFLSENKELFGIGNPERELREKSGFTDELSMTHIKYEQMINGIKIFPAELIVHFNSDGSVESVNGNYIPTPIIKTTPDLSGSRAISIAKQELGNYNAEKESAELMIFRNNLNLKLAYEVKLPSYGFPDMKFIIDAASGEVLEKDNGIRYDGPAVGSGIGLNGTVRQLNTYLYHGKYYLIDASLPMYIPPVDSLSGVITTYDAKNDTFNQGYNKITNISDPNNDNNFNDNIGLRAGVDAQAFVQIVYKFYKSHYNRNSYNNNGGKLVNIVHYEVNYNNAFWNGSFMSYGDGDGVLFSNFAGSLDLVAHELTHGVMGTTAQLVYHLQSGAINESISDCFGCLVDSTNWLLGEDVYTPNIQGDALRNMQDPHNGVPQGNFAWQPANMSEYVNLPDDQGHDWGGVHLNSGIPNKAFYNVASVTGHWKAGQIWYRALTVYLTNNSQFSDLRDACLSSAKDLYGQTSSEYTTVANGFDAVGIPDNSGSVTELIYDNGNMDISVFETLVNWQLAVKFTPPTNNTQIQSVKVFITQDFNNGTGHFSLTLFEANSETGLPGTQLINPFSYTPTAFGWQNFSITGVHVTREFFVSVLFDGVNWSGIGANRPPGNGRAYQYDAVNSSWSQLLTPNDYTLFMRATIKSPTSIVEIDTKVPDKFEISQNYPNPFNPSTTIKYSLPEAADIQITVFDINGNRVTSLADNHQNPGTYTITWNGKNDNGISVSSGVYYYRIKAGNYVKTNKMVLLK